MHKVLGKIFKCRPICKRQYADIHKKEEERKTKDDYSVGIHPKFSSLLI